MTTREYGYVAAQGVALAGLAWPGRPKWSLPGPVKAASVGLTAVGLGVLLAGSRALGRDLKATPSPRFDGTLHSRGPYAVVRHPIYAGLLLTSTGTALLRRRPEPLVAVAALSAVLHLKVGYEEGLLRQRYGAAYDLYSQRVPRLIPNPLRRLRRES